MNEKIYKAVCEQLEYKHNKYNEIREEYERKENGMKIEIDALQEMKDQYETGDDNE